MEQDIIEWEIDTADHNIIDYIPILMYGQKSEQENNND